MVQLSDLIQGYQHFVNVSAVEFVILQFFTPKKYER